VPGTAPRAMHEFRHNLQDSFRLPRNTGAPSTPGLAPLQNPRTACTSARWQLFCDSCGATHRERTLRSFPGAPRRQKRERGANPLRSRHCERRAVSKNHSRFCRNGIVGKVLRGVRASSQETYLGSLDLNSSPRRERRLPMSSVLVLCLAASTDNDDSRHPEAPRVTPPWKPHHS
jgi:hypothetical protein